MAHWRRRGGKGAALIVSIGAHVAAVVVLFAAHVPPSPPEPRSVMVSLVDPPPPPLPPPPPPPPPAPHDAPKSPVKAPTKPPSPEKPKDSARAAPRSPLRVTKAPPRDVIPLPASRNPGPSPVLGLGESELMGAATAGTGRGGGGGGNGCDMVRLLQEGLRKNPRARASLMRAHSATVGAGRAPLVWNGEWTRVAGEEGDGLAGLREMIMMEVAFAPAACRAEPMRGLVLISLNDGPGSARFALGGGYWRWSDLLFAKGARRGG